MAAPLPLTLACGPYDRFRPLMDGAVRPMGIDLRYLPIPSGPEIFARFYKHHEFDVAEFALTFYAILKSQGEVSFTAIPVFPSRMFRHGFIVVREDAKIREPRDLEGKRVGVPEYRQTAAVWIRGMLQHDHGVKLEKIHWLEGGIDKPRQPDEMDVAPAPPFMVEFIKPGQTLSGMLERGELDAYLGSRLPACFGRVPGIQRLFPNPREAECDYYLRTGIFPIMHTLVIRNELLAREPWVAKSLYDACEESKTRCLKDLRFTGASRVMIPWLHADLEEARELFGEDIWPYGVARNRVALEAVAGYLVEQGLAPCFVTPEELFHSSASDNYF
ncbi:MAG: ABC transporter substrate-binding protein [Deltaproteobacteria bacterium]|nr:ABC transporter substrate-binding protein [Deltaproteobacteria bacterium]